MAFLYAILAAGAWLTFCALIAWFVGRVLDYAGDTRENYADQFADAWGEVVNVPEALRPSHIATEPSERAHSQVTQLLLPSTPPSCGR